MSLMEDDFFQKYEQKILLLTEKFMPLKEEDSQNGRSTVRRWNVSRITEII